MFAKNNNVKELNRMEKSSWRWICINIIHSLCFVLLKLLSMFKYSRGHGTSTNKHALFFIKRLKQKKFGAQNRRLDTDIIGISFHTNQQVFLLRYFCMFGKKAWIQLKKNWFYFSRVWFLVRMQLHHRLTGFVCLFVSKLLKNNLKVKLPGLQSRFAIFDGFLLSIWKKNNNNKSPLLDWWSFAIA